MISCLQLPYCAFIHTLDSGSLLHAAMPPSDLSTAAALHGRAYLPALEACCHFCQEQAGLSKLSKAGNSKQVQCLT